MSRSKLLSSMAGVLAALSLTLAPAATANDIVVNTTADENNVDPGTGCSLREALASSDGDAAVGGCATGAAGLDEISFNLPAGPNTIDLAGANGQLFIGAPVTIEGPGASLLAIDGTDGFRVIQANATLNMSGVTVRGGNLTGNAEQGGGIRMEAPLTLTDARVTGNALDVSGAAPTADGGGIYSNTTVMLTRTSVDGNQAIAVQDTGAGIPAARGGGVFTDGGLVLNDSTVHGNTANAQRTAAALVDGTEAAGGGIRHVGALIMDRSTVSGNLATSTNATAAAALAMGGGILSLGEITAELSTVANNRLSVAGATATLNQHGGGISDQTGVGSVFRSVTIAGNGPAATSAGPAIPSANYEAIGGGTKAFSNTIIADPFGTGNGNCFGSTPYFSNGQNIDEDGTCLEFPNMADDLMADPALGPLQNNGGPTQTTLPQTGSVAIDSGSAGNQVDLTHDQRGLARPVDFTAIPNLLDGSDRGAAEVQLPPPPPPPDTGTNPPANTGQRAAALKKCKKKPKRKRKACRKKAAKLPL